MEDGLVSRREMIDMVLRAAALPGAAAFFPRWLNAQGHHHANGDHRDAPPEPDRWRGYQPKFLAREDFEALQAFTEILIPADDYPGAREAGCAGFIDFVLQASEEMPQTQQAWRAAMQSLKETGFYTAGQAQRVELVAAMSRPERDPEAHHPAFRAYRLIKQQTAFAFYTSREGMIQTLDYQGNSYNVTFPACDHPEHQGV